MKKNTVTVVILAIFAYTFYQMGYDIFYKEFMIRKLIAMLLILVGTGLIVISEIKKRKNEKNS